MGLSRRSLWRKENSRVPAGAEGVSFPEALAGARGG